MVLLEIRGDWSREGVVPSLSCRVEYGGLESSLKCNRLFGMFDGHSELTRRCDYATKCLLTFKINWPELQNAPNL